MRTKQGVRETEPRGGVCANEGKVCDTVRVGGLWAAACVRR